jgi:glycosyltransferase involved in cell wall biosynthesis
VGGVKIVAVIPAWNEEGSIGRVVAAVPGDLVAEVIVVNNGSTDRTPEVAEAAGARVVFEPQRGYGAACKAGLDAASNADILVYLDGDASDQPEELANVLGPVTRGEAELVIGSRLLGQREAGAMPPHAVFGNWLTARLVRLLYGVRITDLGSFRAIRRADLEALDMRERTYGWPVEMIVKAARRGYRIHEVPVRHRKRIGKSKVAGTLTGSLKAAFFILFTTFRYALRG